MNTVNGLLPGLVISLLLLSACERDRPDTAASAAEVTDEFDHEPLETTVPVAEAPPTAGAPAPVKPDSGQSFTDLDKNMDSGISRSELAPNEMLLQHFNQADTSGDGSLSYAEIERHRTDMTLEPQTVVTDNRSLLQMDKNGDGGVTRDELWNNEMFYRHFDEADRDRDGTLSSKEVDEHRAAMASGN
ncbi:MAG: hypothetical protein M3Q51_08850 [Pseudomonadota bacterium]|nr:hypothetical protein [Pseudomonadota bacterium]